LVKHQVPTTLKIGETGFGTGLNFLISAYHWLQITDLKCTLEYTSVERYPLKKSHLQRVYTTFTQQWPQLQTCCAEFLAQYPDNFDGTSRQLQFELFDQKIRLNLLIDDATEGLKQLLPTHKSTIDAWYLDGFAPNRNPEMWQSELFAAVAKLSKPGTTLSTFTAAGHVRRGLIEAGFDMHRAPGLGKKREILFGVRK